VADKAEPQPDETNQTNCQSDDVANERKIMMLGEELVPLLDVYAAEPLPNTGDATDHDVREFFLSLEDWWQGTAINTDRRGAKAVRNRIAAALWMDMGRSIPQGYSSEEWVKRQFRHWGNL